MGAFIFLLIGFVLVVGAIWGALLRGLRSDTWKYDNEQLWDKFEASDKGGPSQTHHG